MILRVLITGIDDGGRSCIASEQRWPPAGDASEASADARSFSGASIETLFTTTCPPPPRPAGNAMSVDTEATGTTSWYLVDRGPGTASPLHHTDSYDFDVVLEGSMNLVLDDGPHRLEAGDAVVITGVDHGWHAGPDGCRYLVLVMASPPPA